ncbi:cell cycle response regulator CtrA [Holospora obtusa F1]|uniref:Cell cycle response regulator CtrA n=1 Tax=Holospora obtusa F1 TaxID=1399147 RepID=W6TDZ2_HOLOB|nr:response regulator transcription factor [Holospora obtusa]ETZ06829.1 cell cycle response regulator CtrA [Holospora obtusa F1]
MKVLVIEDHEETSSLIKNILDAQSILADICAEGEPALQIARFYHYDVILVDLLLPDIDGYELLKKLRECSHAPVLILSGEQGIDAKVRTLGFGADDYLTKPFMAEELVARIKALARRAEGHACSIIQVGKLEINLDHCSVTFDGHPVRLTGTEYKILELLMKRKGITLAKTSFLNAIYNGMDEPELKIIDVFVCKIRKKLTDIHPSGGNYVETIWGRGYVLREPEEREIETPIKKSEKSAFLSSESASVLNLKTP